MIPLENNSTDDLYDLMLELLRNFGDPHVLAQSRFAKTRLVQVKLTENKTLSSPEAVQEVFLDLLQIIRVGSEERADLLYMRFWQGLNVEEIVICHNPRQYCERTIMNHQRVAIEMLVLWFIERERALK